MTVAGSTLNSLSTATFLLLAMSIAALIHVLWLQAATADWLMQPIDFGRNWRGRRIFGDNKRLRGLIAMPVAAASSFAVLRVLRPELGDWLARGMWELSVGRYAVLGFAAGLACMLAELPNSFIKRRLDVAPGELPRAGWARVLCPLLDRLDSALGVLIVVSLLVATPAMTWVWVLLVGPPVHAVFSAMLYLLGVKARAL